jgi:rod shape-determining protein MreC
LLLGRRIRENRSTAILTALVVISLLSLASDTRANLVADGVRSVVSLIVYPFRFSIDVTRRATAYSTGLLFNYNAARHEADALRSELIAATAKAADRGELIAENDRLRKMLAFERAEQHLAPVAAEVSVISTRLDGTLVIDRGSFHGIKEGMGVITPSGVVGIVAKAEPFDSTVFTLNHPQCKISATVERSRVAGVVQGNGSLINEAICNLVYLDMKDDVRRGDKVITSGGSHFPRGYPIGTIVERDEGALLKAASIKPVADPYGAEEVFVVRRAQPAVEDLAGPAPEQASAAPTMPDIRPDQEKYAP